jgi:methyl-accepting chemotaxis protein
MMWFRNLKTIAKLMLAFILLSGFMGAVGYEGVLAANTLNTMLNDLYEHQMLGLSVVKEANVVMREIGQNAREGIVSNDKTEIEGIRSEVEKLCTGLNDELGRAEKTLSAEEDKARMARIKQALPEYEKNVKEMVRLSAANDDRSAAEMMRKTRPIEEQIDRDLSDLSQGKEKEGKQTYDDSDAVYFHLRTKLISIVCIAAFLSMSAGFLIARMISKPLVATVGVLEKMAAGDLTASLEVDTTDEVGKMANALNRATEAMRSALTEVRKSADNTSNSAQELASASEQLASGAQEQASSLEETTATLEQITSTVKQNADNAKQASQVASGSRDAAEQGGKVVSDAVAAMAAINQSSKSIADIITTIDEIAFQTNLLALNAAVEAARAGEQGRGFAVVAAEVRNLAQRSATSAKEIKHLIQDSVRKVENGSDLVNKSGDTLREIVGSVKRVNDIVAEIAAASHEQSIGIEQVNKAMIQMDQVTQTNSSQTEELSATAQNLAAHGEELQALVGRFRLQADGAHPAHLVASGHVAHGAPSRRPAAKAPKPLARHAAAAAGSGEAVAAKTEGEPAADHEAAHAFEEF